MEMEMERENSSCVSGLDEQWVRSLKKKVESSGASNGQLEVAKRSSMFRVLERVRATDPSAYEPKVISIGPYHHGKSHLKPMDQLKLLHLKSMLHQRSSRVRLEDCVQLIDGLVARARSCYDGELDMSDSDFSEMLLIDGCFVIELMVAKSNYKSNGVDEAEDPILGNISTRVLVERDMLLLENQLPFFVLEKLYDLLVVKVGENNPPPLVPLAIHFFADHLPRDNLYFLPAAKNIYHLLHLFHSSIVDWQSALIRNRGVSTTIDGESDRGRMVSKSMIPCMTDLLNSGALIWRKEDKKFFNASFNSETMEISPVQLNSNSSSFFRNLMAFEQHFFPEGENPVIAYVMFMGCLIESEKDLVSLRERAIVGYSLNSPEALIFFRKLCEDAIVDYNRMYLSNLKGISIDIHNWYDTPWRQWIALTKTAYFSNPNDSINLIYGVLLVFILTLIQTFYTVYAYYRPPSK